MIEDRKFSQSKFIDKNQSKLNADSTIAIEKYDGLCQAFCGLIAIAGHDDKIVSEMLKKNGGQGALNIINDISMEVHVLNLLSIVEKILITLFKMFPASPMKLSDQKQFLQHDNNNNKTVNSDILKKTFNNMKDNEYMQLSFVEVGKKGPINLLKEDHDILIFETN